MGKDRYKVTFDKRSGILEVYDPEVDCFYFANLKELRRQIPALRAARRILSELLHEIESYLKEAGE